MYLTAHCFLKATRITGLPINFEYKNSKVSISQTTIDKEDALTLQITKPITPSNYMERPEERDPDGRFIEQRLRPIRAELEEVANLLEGLLSVKYNAPVAKFETSKVVINIFPETAEETKLIEEGRVSRGFGDVNISERHIDFQWKNEILSDLDKVSDNLPALSFFAQGFRSQEAKDQEIAFFLYFRILEGYFGDGSGSGQALIDNHDELAKYLPYDAKLTLPIKIILDILKLPTKSDTGFEGMLSDLILIRHKLVHFDKENSERYYNPKVKFEIETINNYLRWACMRILRHQIG